MLQSMTGFGRGEAKNNDFAITVEVKSVNNRFKDFRFKMSNLFNPLEMDLKSKLAKKLKRGSFEIIVNYKKIKTDEQELALDSAKISAFVAQIERIEKLNDVNLQFKATDFLRGEFQKEVDSADLFSVMEPIVLEAFDSALEQISAVRTNEGEKIKIALLEYLNLYQNDFTKIVNAKDLYRQSVENNLLDKIKQFDDAINADKQRLLQEVVYYLEKLDISEEIDRINFHMLSLRKLLDSENDEVGRKIDFLLQELNRETNTIGSKSGNKEISNHVVNMKSFLEKIREQGLNLQ